MTAVLPTALQNNVDRSGLKARESGGSHTEAKTWHQTQPDRIGRDRTPGGPEWTAGL